MKIPHPDAAPEEGRWNDLPDTLQLTLARQALRHAADVLAGEAETLADEMETGKLLDQGGPDALRLFSAVVRSLHRGDFTTVGNA